MWFRAAAQLLTAQSSEQVLETAKQVLETAEQQLWSSEQGLWSSKQGLWSFKQGRGSKLSRGSGASSRCSKLSKGSFFRVDFLKKHYAVFGEPISCQSLERTVTFPYIG